MDNLDLVGPRYDVIRLNSEPTSGEAVEAYYKGTLVHRGTVTELPPNHELFWMTDALTGNRNLVDIAELEIIRVGGAGSW